MSDTVSNTACPTCASLAAQVAALREKLDGLTTQMREMQSKYEARIAELEAQLKTNSSNSSKPPSSDPPWKAPPPKPRSGRKPGGQPGHTGAFRQRLPLERISHVVDYIPETCGHCNTSLVGQYGPHEPEASWHQVAELPDVLAVVTEHRGHERRCACCGKTTRADIPADIRKHCTGPNFAATISFLSGCLHASKRAIEETCETLFGVPISLGTITRLEAETSAALEAPHAQVVAAVRAAPVKNVDETGWAKQGKLCWLWLAATASLAAFVIHAKRGKDGFKYLLGETIVGVVCSDRWSVYKVVDVLRRQLCWAHLKRDFQKWKEMGGEARKTGNAGLRAVKGLFEAWGDWKAKKIGRVELQARLAPIKIALLRALERGRDGPDKKVQRLCKRLLKDSAALWLFAEMEGVEPTNNLAERCLRRAVLWRKRCFGNHSEEGCRFVERLLTTVQTLKLQKRPVLAYLKTALLHHRTGKPAPELVAA